MAADKLTFQDIQAAVAAARARRREEPPTPPEATVRVQPESRVGAAGAPGLGSASWLGGGGEEDPDIPPFPKVPDTDEFDDETRRMRRQIRRRGLVLPAMVVLLALAGFAGAVWWGYRVGTGGGAEEEVPLILAEPGAEKIKPQEEGGLEVPNQTRLIYNEIAPGSEESQVEQLLPEPEAPMAAPAPSVAAATLSEPAAGDDASRPPDEPTADTEPQTTPVTTPAETAPPADAPAAPQAADPLAAPTPAPQVASAGTSTPPAAATVSVPAKPKMVPAGNYRIQLGAFKTESVARAAWAKLKRSNPGVLGGLQLRIQPADLGAAGRFYRVQAGPLPDRGAAEGACARLKKSNQPCLVVRL